MSQLSWMARTTQQLTRCKKLRYALNSRSFRKTSTAGSNSLIQPSLTTCKRSTLVSNLISTTLAKNAFTTRVTHWTLCIISASAWFSATRGTNPSNWRHSLLLLQSTIRGSIAGNSSTTSKRLTNKKKRILSTCLTFTFRSFLTCSVTPFKLRVLSRKWSKPRVKITSSSSTRV